MDTLTLLICLFPIVFMFHDFEEIIFFKIWINKNNAYLRERFPRLSKRFLPRFESLSTSGFALAVAEEFVLLSFITYGSIYLDNYYLWIAAFMAFSIHLIMHVVQWIILRKYVPVIITSLISLPYCIYLFVRILETNMFQVFELVLWTFVGLLIMGINLLFVHKLGEKLDTWIKDNQ
ncbi:MAG: HXXEE domain-containing protein [Bacteroidaceae bacterium]